MIQKSILPIQFRALQFIKRLCSTSYLGRDCCLEEPRRGIPCITILRPEGIPLCRKMNLKMRRWLLYRPVFESHLAIYVNISKRFFPVQPNGNADCIAVGLLAKPLQALQNPKTAARELRSVTSAIDNIFTLSPP